MASGIKVQTVIFDLGRVLVDVDLTRGIFRYLPDLRTGSDRELMKNLFNDPLFRDYGKGKVSAENFSREMCRRLKVELSFEEFKNLWCDIFEPMSGMEDLVKSISMRHRIGLLSDIGPLHWNYLKDNLAVLKYFTNPQLSYQTGLLKPDKRAFDLAAETADSRPEQCLFIDDLESNVHGARSAGMQAVHFSTAENLRLDLEKYLSF